MRLSIRLRGIYHDRDGLLLQKTEGVERANYGFLDFHPNPGRLGIMIQAFYNLNHRTGIKTHRLCAQILFRDEALVFWDRREDLFADSSELA